MIILHESLNLDPASPARVDELCEVAAGEPDRGSGIRGG